MCFVMKLWHRIGLTIINVITPWCISVAVNCRVMFDRKEKRMIDSAFKISMNLFSYCKVRWARTTRKLWKVCNCKCEIRSCSNLRIHQWAFKRLVRADMVNLNRWFGSSEVRIWFEWSGNRMTFEHAKSLKEFKEVSFLAKRNALWCEFYFDSENIMSLS